METLSELGLLGLFISAFLAATILPLSSEIVLSALLLSGLTPTTVVIVATFGNVLGSCTNYALGYWAGKPLCRKVLKMSDQEFVRAEKRFEKYGLLSLCLAWVPIIGDPITVVAGILRVKFHWFVLLVTLGKFSRYAVLSYLVLQAS